MDRPQQIARPGGRPLDEAILQRIRGERLPDVGDDFIECHDAVRLAGRDFGNAVGGTGERFDQASGESPQPGVTIFRRLLVPFGGGQRQDSVVLQLTQHRLQVAGMHHRLNRAAVAGIEDRQFAARELREPRQIVQR